MLEGPQYKMQGPPSCSFPAGAPHVGTSSWFNLWNQNTMWKPTTVFPVPVGGERVSGATTACRPPRPRRGPTWRALNHSERLLQGLSDSPVLAGVELVAASGDVKGLLLQEPGEGP